jgi:hypothetical protein
VQRAFGRLEKATESVELPSRRLAELGLDAARAAVPVRTGELRSGLEIDAGDKGVELRNAVRWGPPQEFGTRWVQAQRFMAAGFDAMADGARSVYEDWLGDQIRKVD